MKTPDDVQADLVAKVARFEDLERQLADARAELAEKERKELLAQLRGDGFLTAHMHTLASVMTLDQLRTFAKDAAPISHLVATEIIEPAQCPVFSGKLYDDMTPGERADLSHKNPELYDAMRADYKSRTGS